MSLKGGKSRNYAGARGFQSAQLHQMRVGDLLSQGQRRAGPISNMWYGASGARQAALHGATVNYDWKTYAPTTPLHDTKAKEKKSPKREAPEMPRVRGTGQPSTTTTTAAPPMAAAAGPNGMATPGNIHFLNNVRNAPGPTYPAGAIGNQRQALQPGSQFSTAMAMGNNHHFLYNVGGMSADRMPLESGVPKLGGGSWNKADAIETSGSTQTIEGVPRYPALGTAKPKPKGRRPAGANPAALGRIQAERGAGGWPG